MVRFRIKQLGKEENDGEQQDAGQDALTADEPTGKQMPEHYQQDRDNHQEQYQGALEHGFLQR